MLPKNRHRQNNVLLSLNCWLILTTYFCFLIATFYLTIIAVQEIGVRNKLEG